MDLIDKVAETFPVNIDNLVDQVPQNAPISAPEASIRNRAAMTALLSESPSHVGQNYQQMMVEAEQGVSYTVDGLVQKASAKQQVKDRQGLMSILADPAISIDEKKAAIAGINSGYNKETSVMVAHAALADASKGESEEAQDVRMDAADQWRDIHAAKVQKQQLINQAYAKASPQFGKLAAEITEQGLMPFATNKMAYGVLNDVMQVLGQKESRIRSAVAPGSSIDQIRKKIENLPAADQLVVQQKLYDLVMSHPNIMFFSDAQYTRAELYSKLIGGQEYSTFDKVLDNTIGVLDLFGVGSLARTGVKKITSLFTKTPANTIDNINLRAATNTTSPVSPIKILEDTNPDKARNIYSMLVKTDGDELAKATTGTTKLEAVAEPMLPQPLARDGSVESKLITPDANLVEEALQTGAIAFSPVERAIIQASLAERTKALQSIVPHDNLVTLGLEGNQIVLKGMFGRPEGGFRLPQQALATTKFNLAGMGVTERDMQLMKKVGDEYVPITLKESGYAFGNYMVRVDSKRTLDAMDVMGFDAFSVKRNWFDRIPLFRSKESGTVANHLMPNATMLSKHITGPAAVGINKSVRLDIVFLRMHEKFTDQFLHLPSDRREQVLDYIKEANHLGIEETPAQLFAKGFVADEVKALQTFRKNWDTHFWFENRDAGRTLSNQGYGVLEASNGDKFFGKPIAKNTKLGEIYDSTLGAVRNVPANEIDDLYNTGGTLARFRSPAKIGGTEVEYMMVRNTPTEFIRKINDVDQILNYRKGYFHVEYTGKFFIYEKKMVNGVEKQVVREIAGSTEEAIAARSRMASAEGKPESAFDHRKDVKELRVDTDAYWDLMSGHGRVAHRHRGKRLEADSTPIGTQSDKYILNPMEAAIRASASLSKRIAMRDFLETGKARAMEQYKDYFPSDGMGGKQWVSDDSSLLPRKDISDSKIADARTTVHYFNYLENGYINSLDSGFKLAMNAIANMMAKSSTVEKSLMWMGDAKPISALKSGVMHAYLALAPIRQLLIQGHQSVRLLGYNPSYMLKDNSIVMAKLADMEINGLARYGKDDAHLYNLIKKSGSLDVVDRHNLVRGIVSEMETNANRAISKAGYAASIPRRIGFDAGEKVSKIMHIAAVRDKFVKEGKNVFDKTVEQEIISVADAMTYGMNFAGDMAYNQNSFSLMLQFLQAPHKALTTVFDRRIPAADRRRMALMDIMLFGIPGATIIENYAGKDMLPDEPKARETIKNGLVSLGYNGFLSGLSDEKMDVDFSSLSPYNMDGFAKMIHSVMKGNMLDAVQNAPAFSLYLKDGGKLQEALGRSFRYFGWIDKDLGLPEETAIDVMKAWAEISSGVSHYQKAAYIVENSKIPIRGQDGITLSESKAFWYAAAQMFGFSSKEEIYRYAALNEQRQFDKGYKDEMEEVYKRWSRILTRDHKLTTDSPEFQEYVLGAVRNAYAGDLEKQQWFHERMAKDLVDQQEVIIQNMIKHANFPTAADLHTAQKDLANVGDPKYKQALQLEADMQAAIKRNIEDNRKK